MGTRYSCNQEWGPSPEGPVFPPTEGLRGDELAWRAAGGARDGRLLAQRLLTRSKGQLAPTQSTPADRKHPAPAKLAAA